MSQLLVVTDNTFYRQGDQVFDRFCFDRRFFDDYTAVFDEVRVAARVRPVTATGAMHRADGEGVTFVDLDDVHGARWVLSPWRRHCAALGDAVASADALCVRLPAVAGWHATRLARRADKPVMFELIGDPMAAGVGAVGQRIGGLIMHRQTRAAVRACRAGSYVSREHLQQRYPPGAGAVTASISSIRLPAGAFRPARVAPHDPRHLRLLMVASFLPVKNHATLLRAIALARRQGPPVTLTLVGDGPLRPAIERQIAALGIAAAVELNGHLAGRAQVEAALDAADAFVMPSWSEGMPRAAIEAMARGLPTIGSNVGGLRELLPDDQVFDPREPETIVGRLSSLLNPAVYRRSASLCRRRASDFSGERLAARRRRLLGELRAVGMRTRHAGAAAAPIGVVAALGGDTT